MSIWPPAPNLSKCYEHSIAQPSPNAWCGIQPLSCDEHFKVRKVWWEVTLLHPMVTLHRCILSSRLRYSKSHMARPHGEWSRGAGRRQGGRREGGGEARGRGGRGGGLSVLRVLATVGGQGQLKLLLVWFRGSLRLRMRWQSQRRCLHSLSAAEAFRTPLTSALIFKQGTGWSRNCRKSTAQQGNHRETLEL